MAEKYEDLIFRLGDLARERLAKRPSPPRSIDRVLRAEDALFEKRGQLEELEERLNREDAAFRESAARAEAERREQKELAKKWRRVVDAIEGRTGALRSKLKSQKATLRYEQEALRKAEERHADLEERGDERAASSREGQKSMRLAQMRRQREIEALEAELGSLLTPEPGQPGAAGILAHKRLLELDDEVASRKEAHQRTMAELEEAIVAKEQEVSAAEDYLDQAVFLLGEEVYSSRVADPALAALYPLIDRAR